METGKPIVLGLFVANDKGEPMQEVSTVMILAGKGIVRDRYGKMRGSYSHAKRVTIRHVSFIALEDIARANEGEKEKFLSIHTRRNILTYGIDLLSLIGKEFSIGGVLFRGVEECAPCERPSSLCGMNGFLKRFKGRGGLRAEALTSGEIKCDEIIQLRTCPRLNLQSD